MPCSTCSHTMQLLFQDRARTIFHCPRCGTMRSDFMGHVDDAVPWLVERCRKATDCWRYADVREAMLPEDQR